MKVLENLKYTKSHEWVEILEDGKVRVGVTDFAQEGLGELVFINLPEVGDEVAAGESFSDVESVKAVSEVNSPVNGTVAEINEAIMDDPASVNSDPYGAWFITVENVESLDDLLDAAAYQALCDAE